MGCPAGTSAGAPPGRSAAPGAAQHDLHRLGLAHRARQPLRPAQARDDAQGHLRLRPHGQVGRQPNLPTCCGRSAAQTCPGRRPWEYRSSTGCGRMQSPTRATRQRSSLLVQRCSLMPRCQAEASCYPQPLAAMEQMWTPVRSKKQRSLPQGQTGDQPRLPEDRRVSSEQDVRQHSQLAAAPQRVARNRRNGWLAHVRQPSQAPPKLLMEGLPTRQPAARSGTRVCVLEAHSSVTQLTGRTGGAHKASIFSLSVAGPGWHTSL